MSWQGEGQEGERERQKGGEWERGVVGKREKRQEREARRGEGAGRTVRRKEWESVVTSMQKQLKP